MIDSRKEHQMIAMWIPGTAELVLIAFVGVLLFGSRIPKIARSIGSSFVEFKRGVSGVESEIKEIKDEFRKP